MYLETTDIYKIIIDFPDKCYPTCQKCGNKMDSLTIMTSCLFTERDEKLKADNPFAEIISDLEGKTTHIHFHHGHPNNDNIGTAFYCPLTDNRW